MNHDSDDPAEADIDYPAGLEKVGGLIDEYSAHLDESGPEDVRSKIAEWVTEMEPVARAARKRAEEYVRTGAEMGAVAEAIEAMQARLSELLEGPGRQVAEKFAIKLSEGGASTVARAVAGSVQISVGGVVAATGKPEAVVYVADGDQGSFGETESVRLERLTREQTFFIVLICLFLVGLPLAQGLLLPPTAQSVISDEYGTIPMAMMFASLIANSRKR